MSIPFRFEIRGLRAGWHREGRRSIGMGRIEMPGIVGDEFLQREMILSDSFDDAAGEFVAAVVVVMRAVLECFAEIGAERGVKRAAHLMEIDEGEMVLFGQR